jgi:type IV secretory pathway TraG/TraD family ATPase VirD4
VPQGEGGLKKISVFEGFELGHEVPNISNGNSRCRLFGIRDNGDNVDIPINDELLSQHILLLGGTGTGKTNALFQMLRQLKLNMTENDVMVIFDTKGDYHKEFYRPGDIVISNDETATGPEGKDYWNIFKELLSEETLEEDILEITRTLFFDRVNRSNQPFFPNAAKDLFSGILFHFSRIGDGLDINNARLREFLDSANLDKIRDLLKAHTDLRAMTSYISDDRSPQTQGVISELQQMVRELFVVNFRKPGSLSMRSAIRSKGGRAIIIEYDLGIGTILTPVYRLLLDLAIKESLSRKKSEGNVWFIIDEFRLIPHLQHIDDGVNFGRSLGAKFIIGAQSIEQIYHAYGESLARSILSGFMTTISFRVNDASSRDFVKSLYGRNRKRDVYMPTVHSRGVVENVRDANVVEDWDIAQLPTGKAIVGIPGHHPFLFQFVKYESDISE